MVVLPSDHGFGGTPTEFRVWRCHGTTDGNVTQIAIQQIVVMCECLINRYGTLSTMVTVLIILDLTSIKHVYQ